MSTEAPPVYQSFIISRHKFRPHRKLFPIHLILSNWLNSTGSKSRGSISTANKTFHHEPAINFPRSKTPQRHLSQHPRKDIAHQHPCRREETASVSAFLSPRALFAPRARAPNKNKKQLTRREERPAPAQKRRARGKSNDCTSREGRGGGGGGDVIRQRRGLALFFCLAHLRYYKDDLHGERRSSGRFFLPRVSAGVSLLPRLFRGRMGGFLSWFEEPFSTWARESTRWWCSRSNVSGNRCSNRCGFVNRLIRHACLARARVCVM